MTIRARAETTEPARLEAGRLSVEAAGARLSDLFEQHGRMVYGVCRLLLRDADEAEDAAQQVFLSAYRSLLGGTEPQDPAAWLGTIARNESRARIRAGMERSLALVEQDAPTADAALVAAQRAEIEALCGALAELPQQQREAIVLREFYGLSYDEVRAALGVTDAAVESLIFRARKRLQEELRPARLASGAIALPIALRDAIAGAVPGFASGSGSGGLLAKLGSLPLVAKLAASAATLTAAGTIGFAEIQARDHDHGSSVGKPVARDVQKSAPKERDLHATAASSTFVAFDSSGPGGGGDEGRGAEQNEEQSEGGGGGNEGPGEAETAPAETREEGSVEPQLPVESGESGESDSGSGSGDSGLTGSDD
jgi:RNA polymerase sigma-70 factor, ECF subfamily